MGNRKEIELCSCEELNLKKTFECGQCFRWNVNNEGKYFGTAGEYPAYVFERQGKVIVDSCAPKAFWEYYFDLDTDYSAADESFRGYSVYLDECSANGKGIRILRQDPWEAVCSFIISQCNNIKRIQGIVERLCEYFGEEAEFDGKKTFLFPSAESLSKLEPEDLAVIRSGYRAEYIVSAAKSITAGILDLDSLFEMDWPEAVRTLKCQKGIGEKVANCIVLFGFHHLEAFPVDTWIRKALKEFFPAGFDPNQLGPYAGLAQQYIFYSIRE